MEFLIIIVVAIGLLVWRDQASKKKAELQRRKAHVIEVVNKAQIIADKIGGLKTTTAKASNCGKALKLLESIDHMPESREMVRNFDEISSRLASMQKVFPVIDFVEKSYKHRFKGKDKAELNSLQDALYEISTQGVEDKDFVTAMVFPEGTGEIVTISGIKDRCIELGWEPKSSL